MLRKVFIIVCVISVFSLAVGWLVEFNVWMIFIIVVIILNVGSEFLISVRLFVGIFVLFLCVLIFLFIRVLILKVFMWLLIIRCR